MTARVTALAADLADFMGLAGAAPAPRSEGGLDAARISQVRELEVLKSAACALQACTSSAFSVSQRAAQEQAGVSRARSGRGIPSQIGLARRESPNKATQLLGLATCLVKEMPHTLAALARGELNEWRATIISRETAVLSQEDRAAVDRELCGPGGHAGDLGDAAISRAAREIGQRLDPGASWARAQKAERERRVTIRPAPDCMVTLTAHLPVVQGVGVFAALSAAADTAIAQGQRNADGIAATRGQLMTDELIMRILNPHIGRAASPANSSRPASPTTPASPAGSPAASPAGPISPTSPASPAIPEPSVEIQLIMTDRTLFGMDDSPAHLTGYGPIPAPLARRIAAGGDTSERWIRRLYEEPGSARRLIAMDSHRRYFPGGLRRFIIARDQFCRTPWCDALIRHTDHIQPADDGGPTSASNAQGLCEACNHAKQAPGWEQSAGPAGQVTTTTPTAHQYTSWPPSPPGTLA